MYYYRRPSKKKWIILLILLIVLGAGGYWFYQNYYQPPQNQNQHQNTNSVQAGVSIYAAENDVKADIGNMGFKTAQVGQQLSAGDKVKTGTASRAILLINSSVIRLAESSQLNILLISPDKIIVEQISGQSYHKVSGNNTYTVKALNTVTNAVGTKFNVRLDADKKTIDLAMIEGKVNFEVIKQSETLLSALIEKNETLKASLTADKKDILRFSEFKIDDLKKEDWYKYNFSEDEKNYAVNNNTAVNPAANELELTLKAGQDGNELTWVPYTKNDFQIYKIVRSETNANLIFPADGYIFGSPDNDLTTYIDKDITAGKDYYYRICVLTNLNQVNCGNPLSVQAAQNEAEKDILQLSGTVENNQIKLAWNKYENEDYSFFKVVRSETNADLRYPADGYVKTFYSADDLSYIDDKAVTGKSYYYRICVKQKSDGKVLCGSVAQVKAPEGENAGDISISASAKDNGIYLSWNKIESDVFGSYKILKSETDSVLEFNPNKVINTINLNSVTSFTDSAIEAGKKYFYRVCYILQDGSQTCSAVINVTAKSQEQVNDTEPPSAPSLMVDVNASGVSLSWTKNSEADFKEYRIVRSQINSSPIYPAAGSLGSRSKGSENYLDSSVTSTSAGTYYYRVCAVDTSNNVNCGNVVKVVNGVVE